MSPQFDAARVPRTRHVDVRIEVDCITDEYRHEFSGVTMATSAVDISHLPR